MAKNSVTTEGNMVKSKKYSFNLLISLMCMPQFSMCLLAHTKVYVVYHTWKNHNSYTQIQILQFALFSGQWIFFSWHLFMYKYT